MYNIYIYAYITYITILVGIDFSVGELDGQTFLVPRSGFRGSNGPRQADPNEVMQSDIKDAQLEPRKSTGWHWLVIFFRVSKKSFEKKKRCRKAM